MGRVGGFALVLMLAASAAGQQGEERKQTAGEAQAIARGVAFLRTKLGENDVGRVAMIALALVKADAPGTDPGLMTCMAKIRERFAGTSTYSAQGGSGIMIYEAAVVIMAMASVDAEGNRSAIATAAQFIISKQNPNGSWDYTGRNQGDTSISQFALLGLWEAENAGFAVPPEVYDRAAGWYLSVQDPSGSWNYHRDEAGQYPETLSMTAAGVGSLLICQKQLARHRRGTDSVNPLLTPLVTEATASKYKPAAAARSINEGITGGIRWIGQNFTASNSKVMGNTPYYGLYGMERVGALADKETLGGVDWFNQGLRFLLSTQKPDGSWNEDYGDIVNTSWAIMFMTKATRKTIERVRIKRLGAGTLLGGRGLPKDLSAMTVANGRVMVRPMGGGVEAMLAVLEDPRAENADAALAGLVQKYQERGTAAMRPLKDRFRRLLKDRDPGVRSTAVWGLGRSGDLDVIPLLIGVLRDPKEDDAVVAEARTSLQFLSRKIDGYGPPNSSTPEQRAEAADKWQAWYDAIRPIDAEGADDAPAPAATR